MGDVVGVGRYTCGVCGRGVGANSVRCTACGKWCQKRCSGLGCLRAVAVSLFRCPGLCLGQCWGGHWHGGGVIGEVKQFCSLRRFKRMRFNGNFLCTL